MKVTKIINVSLQGIGLIGTVVALLLCYSENKENGYSFGHFEQDAAIIIVIAEVMLAGYQIIHAFVVSILKLVRKEFEWMLGIYWMIGLAYVIGCFVFLAISNFMSTSDDAIVTAVLLGWIPIIYYFIISIIYLVRALKT